MHKKIKFSLAEKKLTRMVIVLTFIQLVIIFFFIYMLIGSQQINVNDTRQIDITVDDIYCFRVSRSNWLLVVSNSTEYLFTSRSTFEEYSVSELYETIAEGSKLSLRYYETHMILGKFNLVVDARSETETYRSIEEYNRGKQGVPAFVTIIFSIIELIFVGIVLIYVWLNYNTVKGIYKKFKKHRFKPKD